MCLLFQRVLPLSSLTGASVKVIQLLQHFEQLSSVFAQAVFVWSTEYGIRAIIGEVIRSVHMYWYALQPLFLCASLFAMFVMNRQPFVEI